MNYTWDDIKLNNFIKASEGDLSYVSKNNEINKDTLDAWFSIQDQYIRVLDLETIQMKRYKKVCYNYAKSLQQWIIEPTNGSKLFNKVNQLYIEKTKLAESMFNDEKKDWDVLIAQVTLSTKQRVNGDWLAKEFFNLIKVL